MNRKTHQSHSMKASFILVLILTFLSFTSSAGCKYGCAGLTGCPPDNCCGACNPAPPAPLAPACNAATCCHCVQQQGIYSCEGNDATCTGNNGLIANCSDVIDCEDGNECGSSCPVNN